MYQSRALFFIQKGVAHYTSQIHICMYWSHALLTQVPDETSGSTRLACLTNRYQATVTLLQSCVGVDHMTTLATKLQKHYKCITMLACINQIGAMGVKDCKMQKCCTNELYVGGGVRKIVQRQVNQQEKILLLFLQILKLC